jgi:hypothetical protein
MLFGNRGRRLSAARRRGECNPRLQVLEERCLLAIDLGFVAPPGQPNIATQPYGVLEAGAQSSGGSGFSVADVGDVNGDGFDDFVIGSPTVVNISGQIQPGTGANAQVQLVFGSLNVNAAQLDWLTLDKTGSRVGDLGQLNLASQTNPISGQPTNPYAGVTFITGSTPGSQLGASVAAANGLGTNGLGAFLIGAPGYSFTDSTGTHAGAGRAFLITGDPSLSTLTGQTVDLDNPGTQTFKIIAFTTTLANSHLGLSVAGLDNFLSTGSTASDIAIGAPDASVGGLTDNGDVYVIAGNSLLGAGSGTVNILSVGQGGGLPGAQFIGADNGDEIGRAVAGAGDVNGVINTLNQPVDGLLIGAPNMSGRNGQAYLVYGGNQIPGQATNVGGLNAISVSRIGGTGNTSVAGATFVGSAAQQAGFAVAGIGDYNGDGFDDIAIGSPFFTATGGFLQAGEVNVFYGQPASGTTLTGTIPLNTIPTGIPQMTLVGAAPLAMAGYSISKSGKITPAETGNDFLVGSPGLNSDQGGVYLIPSNPFQPTGTVQLLSAESQPLAATLIQITNTGGNTPSFLGTSVSGRIVSRSQTKTADADTLADFIVGAPGYGVVSGRSLDGGAFMLEGKFTPVQTPINTAITTVIGVGQPFGPFVVNAANPNALNIYVFSTASVSPPFAPVTAIDPTSIIVNGVPFPNATVAQDPVDENQDGIPDAIVTITPRSRIGLTTATTTFTIRGNTLASSPNAGVPFTGSQPITVTGSVVPPVVGTGGIGLGQVGLPPGLVIPSSFIPSFSPDSFVPSIAAMSKLDYKPIPLGVAYSQYLPSRGFQARVYNINHPDHPIHPRNIQILYKDKVSFRTSLHKRNFTYDQLKRGHTYVFRHKGPVIPVNLQHERFTVLPAPRTRRN